MDPLQLPVPNWTDWSAKTSTNSTAISNATTTSSAIATAVQAALELIQRYAILTLTIIPASSDGSDDDMIGRPVCEWRNTVCNETTVPWLYNPNIVVTYIAVTRIKWSNVGGDGRLRPDLGLLSSLVHFDVSSNYIDGSIPDELELWTNVQYFNVSHTELTGSLPSSLGKWTAIESVDFDGNDALTGSIPSSVANWTILGDKA